jgi:hypothetical protein
MTLKLKRTSHSPSPFSWDALSPPRAGSPNAPEVTGLPPPPTSWLSARDMKIFGAQPLRADIGVVRCADCDKPILRSAVSEHISMSWLSPTDRYLAHAQSGNCNDIRSGKKWVKGKTADSEGTVSSYIFLSSYITSPIKLSRRKARSGLQTARTGMKPANRLRRRQRSQRGVLKAPWTMTSSVE